MIKKYWIPIVLLSTLLFKCGENSVKRGYESLSLGDYDMSIEFFNNELRCNPRNFEARIGMGKALLQKSYANNQDTIYWHKALIQLQAARSIEANKYLDSLLKDAWIIYSRKKLAAKDTMAALTSLTFALDHDPNNTEALNLSGILFGTLGFIEKAESLFTAAGQNNTNKDVLFNLGMLRFYRKQYSEAAHIWKSMSDIDSSDLELKHWIRIAEQSNK